MSYVKRFAAQITTAVTNGQDPIKIDFSEARSKAGETRMEYYSLMFFLAQLLFDFDFDFDGFCVGLSKCMGSDTTMSAVENRFRPIKVNARIINDALKKGMDPLTLGIGSDKCQDFYTSYTAQFLFMDDKLWHFVLTFIQRLLAIMGQN